MLRLLVFVWFFMGGAVLFSQRTYEPAVYTRQLELSHDNDFILLTDRYYSSGLFLTYRTLLKKGASDKRDHQLNFKLGQEVYTPSQTQSTDTNIFDRPYAGFSGLRTTWSSAKKNSLYNTTVLLGIAGLNSGAGGFQRWFHRVVAISDSPLWIGELNDSFHFNLNFRYVKEWVIAANPFGVRLAFDPEVALGTRDIFFEPRLGLHFGRRNDVSQSIAYNRLGSNAREIYFSLNAGYRFVLHNGLIEGNLLGDTSPLLKDPENSVLSFGFNFNHRFDRNDFKIGVHYNSPETPEARSHKFLSLGYGYAF